MSGGVAAVVGPGPAVLTGVATGIFCCGYLTVPGVAGGSSFWVVCSTFAVGSTFAGCCDALGAGSACDTCVLLRFNHVFFTFFPFFPACPFFPAFFPFFFVFRVFLFDTAFFRVFLFDNAFFFAIALGAVCLAGAAARA